jgi:hypothetical protein
MTASGTWRLYGKTVSITQQAGTVLDVSSLQWDGGRTLTLTDREGSVPVTIVFSK